MGSLCGKQVSQRKPTSGKQRPANDATHGEKGGGHEGQDYHFLHRLPPQTARFQEAACIALPNRETVEKSAKDPKLDWTWRVLQEPKFLDMHEVSPGLFLTSFFGMTKEAIQGNGITWIVNATIELPKFKPFKDKTLRIPVTDDRSSDINPFLEHAADAIHELISHKEKVVVHCQAGVSRSTVIVLAYLIKWHKMSLRSAYNMVYNKRPVIRPNTTFLHALVKFEGQHLPPDNTDVRTKIIQVKKKGKLVDLPNWLWYDQIQAFDQEFDEHRKMNAAHYKDPNRLFVDLDQDPTYFADHELEVLGQKQEKFESVLSKKGSVSQITTPIQMPSEIKPNHNKNSDKQLQNNNNNMTSSKAVTASKKSDPRDGKHGTTTGLMPVTVMGKKG